MPIADIAYRNIAGVLGRDGGLAEKMGLRLAAARVVTVEAGRTAIQRGDFDEMARLLSQLRARTKTPAAVVRHLVNSW